MMEMKGGEFESGLTKNNENRRKLLRGIRPKSTGGEKKAHIPKKE